MRHAGAKSVTIALTAEANILQLELTNDGDRYPRTDEGLEIISRLWRQESVDFDGVHYKLRGAVISPKPVQADLPMWIGGGSKAAIQRTGKYGTGWQAGPETPAEAAPIVTAIKAAAKAAGRTIDDDHYGAGFPFYFGSPSDPDAIPRGRAAVSPAAPPGKRPISQLL